MSDYLTSLIRTVVPTIVGAAVAWLIARGVDLNPDTPDVDIDPTAVTALSAALVALCIGLYYAAARGLEQRWPQAGWLLGAAKQPAYVAHEPGDGYDTGEDEVDDDEDDGPPSAAPPEWLAKAGAAPGDAIPEAADDRFGPAVK